MDARTRPPSVALVALGQLVTYREGSNPPRAAFVGHVHEDGRSCDLVVLMDGDARLAETRQAWAMGSGVVRARTGIPHVSDDPARLRCWAHGDERDRLG